MKHIVADLPKRCKLRADTAYGLAMPNATEGTRGPPSNFVSHDVVTNHVVRHSDPECSATLRGHASDPIHRALLPPRTDDHVRTEGVVHLIPVLHIEPNCLCIPNDVLVHCRAVCAVHRDPNMLGPNHCVALEDTRWAPPHDMEVQAIPAHQRPLAAMLHARVAHVHVPRACHDRVQTLPSRFDVIMVSRDAHVPLHVDDLSSKLKAATCDFTVSSPMFKFQGLRERQGMLPHRCYSVNGGSPILRVGCCSGHTNVVPNTPTHRRWIMLQVQHLGAGRSVLRK
mmetsp:Transcript_34863/g.88564  ORF Transcript_34863/g.88564 Transcript_34863/m.88564 type:complete len:283 (+) Transcript_34863:3276-4124(+)